MCGNEEMNDHMIENEEMFDEDLEAMEIGDQLHDDYLFVCNMIEYYKSDYAVKLRTLKDEEYRKALEEYAQQVFNDAPLLDIESIKCLIESNVIA